MYIWVFICFISVWPLWTSHLDTRVCSVLYIFCVSVCVSVCVRRWYLHLNLDSLNSTLCLCMSRQNNREGEQQLTRSCTEWNQPLPAGINEACGVTRATNLCRCPAVSAAEFTKQQEQKLPTVSSYGTSYSLPMKAVAIQARLKLQDDFLPNFAKETYCGKMNSQ